MNPQYESDLKEARELIQRLQDELKLTHEELDRTNQEFLQLTLELDDRVEKQTADLRASEAELARHRDRLQELVDEKIAEIQAINEKLQNHLNTLQFSEERFRSIIYSLSDEVCVVDPETYDILFLNNTLAEKHGDAVGRKCYHALYGLDRPCDFCVDHGPFNSPEQGPRLWEYHDTSADRWYRCVDKAIRWPDGRMVRFEMKVDITQLKEAEAVLRRSSVSRRMVGELIGNLKKAAGLRTSGLYHLGRELAGQLSGDGISEFLATFTNLGFGTVVLETADPEKQRWTFNGFSLMEMQDNSEYPMDHFTRGFLCGAMSRITGSDKVLGVETDCQSMGDRACRFIVQVIQ